MNNEILIISERFFLRELTVDDATERYLSWFMEPGTREYISAATKTKSILNIKEYIHERIGREDILFLGIFEKKSGLHIGNIKYEPVDTKLSYAIMGILIGDKAYRGKSVGTEVLKASAQWLKLNKNIRQIVLGVSKDNINAIRSYTKTGFVIEESPHLINHSTEAYIMVWHL